eukprot:TRINITY_DN705_c1_g1_i1.p1 TRINITY_DN705_c1_g1~~TRINITY_DN705_c1_g1_i1.p1  ORF type:complete len:1109 (-),score=351.66 TRINITY_DN705_c1_g1_i1:112-3438(-)
MAQIGISTEDPTLIFELIEEIAVGSFGSVYRGRHLPSSEIVAVKICPLEDEDSMSDLLLEIDILRKCDHKNIVKFFGSYQKGDEIYIAMELCEGGACNTLYEVLEQPIPEPLLAFIIHETLLGLVYLHEKNIIHRDIKAANILLTNSGEVKLADFGVSAQMKSRDDKRNTFVGTPYWMAPEVINTKDFYDPYDQKVDVWALGITCFELAEMDPPLSDIPPMQALFQIPKRDAPRLKSPEKWSKEFNDFIAQCLVKDRAQRKTAEDMLKHPFLQMRADRPQLEEHIKKVQRVASEYQAKEKEDEETRGENGKDTLHSDQTTDGDPSTQSTPVQPRSRAQRTYRPKTQKEEKSYAAKLVAEKLVAQQVAVRKKLQKQFQQEIIELEKQQKSELQAFVRRGDAAKLRLQKTLQSSDQKLKNQHTYDFKNIKKQLDVQEVQAKKQQANDFKNAVKDILTEQRQQNKELLDRQSKEEKDELKQEKDKIKQEKINKKDAKVIHTDNKEKRIRRQTHQNLLLLHKQQLGQQQNEQTLQQNQLKELIKTFQTHLLEAHSMQFEHLKQLQTSQIESMKQEQLLEKESHSNQSAFELKLQAIARQQTRDQLHMLQTLESEQQQKQLLMEYRTSVKEFKLQLKNQLKEEEKLLKQREKETKLGKKEKKQAQLEFKEKIANEQAYAELKHLHMLAQQRLRQETQLAQHQKEVRTRQEEQIHKLNMEHQTKQLAITNQLATSQQAAQHLLLLEHNKTRTELFGKHHVEEGEALNSHHTLLKNQLAEHHLQQKTLLAEQQASAIQFVDQLNLTKEQVEQEHLATSQQLDAKQNNELAQLNTLIETQITALREQQVNDMADLAREKRNLERYSKAQYADLMIDHHKKREALLREQHLVLTEFLNRSTGEQEALHDQQNQAYLNLMKEQHDAQVEKLEQLFNSQQYLAKDTAKHKARIDQLREDQKGQYDELVKTLEQETASLRDLYSSLKSSQAATHQQQLQQLAEEAPPPFVPDEIDESFAQPKAKGKQKVESAVAEWAGTPTTAKEPSSSGSLLSLSSLKGMSRSKTTSSPLHSDSSANQELPSPGRLNSALVGFETSASGSTIHKNLASTLRPRPLPGLR